MTKQHIIKLSIVVVLILIGIIIDYANVLEPERIIAVAREYADNWWLIFVLVLLQSLLYTFALAGSMFLWVAATLYPPETSALILTAGGTIGGLTAYYFSKHLTGDWVRKVETSYGYKILKQQNNFFTLFALRVFPAFPHSIINYSSGILNSKLIYFIVASISGISIKSYVYSKIIYNATTPELMGSLFELSSIGPLIILSLASFAVVIAKYKKSQKR